MDAVEVVAAVLVLVLLHVVGPRLRFITYIPRSIWLSFAGGVAVSYVFVHLLPELAARAEGVAEVSDRAVVQESLLWLLALAGLVFFYVVEILMRRGKENDDASRNGTFWLTVGSFAIYNAMIGYLLHERAAGSSVELVLFVAAMSLHFLINDFSLRARHRRQYQDVGRWLLVAGIGLGAAAGFLLEVTELVLAAILAVIAGGVVLNVLKEEVPAETQSRLGPFLLGVTIYSAILLTI